MPRFAYSAMDSAGRTVRGRMDAENLHDLEQRLLRMQLDLLDGRVAGTRALGLARKPLTRRELVNFCFQLQQLAAAGVPLLEGLADIRDTDGHPPLRGIVAELIESIESGKHLSEALAQHPRLFDEVFVSLVRAGELSGQLPTVFQHLVDALKWQDELHVRTRQMVMYPGMVAVVVLGVMYFLLTWLVPQLVPFLIGMGGTLPWSTRTLIFVSGILGEYGLLAVTASLAVFAAAHVLVRVSRPVRLAVDRRKLGTWLSGPILHNIVLSRFARLFSLMHASGITVLDGLKLAEKAMGNLAMEEGLARARVQIANGERVSEAFASVGMFPPLVVRMIRVGEATGRFDSALANVSDYYAREVKEAIDQLQAVLPVIMTLLLGGMLGLVMLAVLGPIYDTISKLQF